MKVADLDEWIEKQKQRMLTSRQFDKSWEIRYKRNHEKGFENGNGLYCLMHFLRAKKALKNLIKG